MVQGRTCGEILRDFVQIHDTKNKSTRINNYKILLTDLRIRLYCDSRESSFGPRLCVFPVGCPVVLLNKSFLFIFICVFFVYYFLDLCETFLEFILLI